VRFYCDEELANQPDQAKWQKEDRVTQPGKVFEAIGPQAQKFLLADAVLKNFDELKQRYNLEKDPTLLEPGWADELVQALASPWLSVILLMIAFAATYAELHTPGMGVGGFIAAVCFALFFWSRFLGGTAGWLEVTLFAAGVACLLLEIFVLPGFAIFGLGGGLLIIASLVLASQTFAVPHNDYQIAQFQQSLLILAGAVGGTICLAMIINRWLPKTPVLGRIVHQPFTEEEIARVSHNESLAHFDSLLGARGTAATQLVPGGKALFGDRLVDVMADGQFIERGEPVVVVQVEGYRVVVRPASEISPA
jgi:membrane-bound serine protease (ClpP class)